MQGYLSVCSTSTHEKVIERSRFIARCGHVEGEEEARAFIGAVRAEHSLATHNCFAFVADKAGNLLRFSDDGEPQGTAGMPILEVIRSKKLFETAIVVTRYFGGIKLGAGGLVRAYAGAAADVLAGADIRAFTPCSITTRCAAIFPRATVRSRTRSTPTRSAWSRPCARRTRRLLRRARSTSWAAASRAARERNTCSPSRRSDRAIKKIDRVNLNNPICKSFTNVVCCAIIQPNKKQGDRPTVRK